MRKSQRSLHPRHSCAAAWHWLQASLRSSQPAWRASSGAWTPQPGTPQALPPAPLGCVRVKHKVTVWCLLCVPPEEQRDEHGVTGSLCPCASRRSPKAEKEVFAQSPVQWHGQVKPRSERTCEILSPGWGRGENSETGRLIRSSEVSKLQTGKTFYLSSQTAIKIELLQTVVDLQLLTERKSSSPVGTAQQEIQRLATACCFIFFLCDSCKSSLTKNTINLIN